MIRRAALLVACVFVAACAPGVPRTTFPPIGSTPQPAGGATAATTKKIVDALSAEGLETRDGIQAYRPPEGALLAAAPRTLLEVLLPDDPEPGRILVYSFPTSEAAFQAAKDGAEYLRSNTGGIIFAPGTQFILNVVDANVVFFSWYPPSSPDPGSATIAQTLALIGQPVLGGP